MNRHATILALLVLIVLAPATGGTQTRDAPLVEGQRTLRVQREHYGTLAPDHPTVTRVRSIFDKIVRVAGRRPGPVIEIYVLDTPKVVGESLRGGLIVVSQGLVDLAGSDDALAFVLAHELAHEVRDHHGILDSLGVFGASLTEGRASVPPDQVLRAYRAVELDADRLGVLFTSLAGYKVSSAIPVLQRVIERSGSDLFHPSQTARAAAIQDQLGEIVDHFEVLPLGLFLLATGRYLDAARVLEQFVSVFPSREVMSAVGVALHKDGLRYAPPPEFQHLLAIDAATRAPTTRGGLHPVFRQRLNRAIHYYALAVDADPSYAPALNNLATAYLDLGERDLALGYINRALGEDPSLASAYNNRALAALMAKDYKRAEEDFLIAARLAPRLQEITDNLAHLYERMGRSGEARRWAQARGPEVAPKESALDVTGVIVPGQPAARLTEWQREPGTRQIKLPLENGTDRELTLVVFSRRGLAAVLLDGQIDAVGILSNTSTPATMVRGVRPGDPVARITSAYGRPEGLEGIQALNVSAFPSRMLVFFAVSDRVQTIWAGHAPPSKR